MSTNLQPSPIGLGESLDLAPEVALAESEYRRLLGYPVGHEPSPRARELAEWARHWYAERGRPWVYRREVRLQLGVDGLRLDGAPFVSPLLDQHLRAAGAQRAMVVAVSAGRALEEQARQLWQEGKPDEYFLLEVLGSAVVEHLVAGLSGGVCAQADREGFVAMPHYSPGYTGWDIADQTKLFALLRRGRTRAWPEPLEVLSSGMLRPKKSLLAVVGLAPKTAETAARTSRIACEACALQPCAYRRAVYRHALTGRAPAADFVETARTPHYTVAPRTLRKWADERLQLVTREDGTIRACFRFDGTTCSNLGQPLAFDYGVVLGPATDGHRIVDATCQPAAGEEGHRLMCAYLSAGDELLSEIAAEAPPRGRTLAEALAAPREPAPLGCLCTTASRAHKWGLALEVIHYALTQVQRAPAAETRAPNGASLP